MEGKKKHQMYKTTPLMKATNLITQRKQKNHEQRAEIAERKKQ